MYKQLSSTAVKELEESGCIILTIKAGWEPGSVRQALPYNINYQIGVDLERIFRCYLHIYEETVEVTNVEPAPMISDQENLVDAYLGIAIQGIVKYAKSLSKSHVVISSRIPSAAEHLADKGFTLVPRGLFPARVVQGFLRI